MTALEKTLMSLLPPLQKIQESMQTGYWISFAALKLIQKHFLKPMILWQIALA